MQVNTRTKNAGGSDMFTRPSKIPVVVYIVSIFALLGCSRGGGESSSPLDVQALEIGTEAYIYAYPLVLMDMTKRMHTNVPSFNVNQFFHGRTSAGPDDSDAIQLLRQALYFTAGHRG